MGLAVGGGVAGAFCMVGPARKGLTKGFTLSSRYPPKEQPDKLKPTNVSAGREERTGPSHREQGAENARAGTPSDAPAPGSRLRLSCSAVQGHSTDDDVVSAPGAYH